MISEGTLSEIDMSDLNSPSVGDLGMVGLVLDEDDWGQTKEDGLVDRRFS